MRYLECRAVIRGFTLALEQDMGVWRLVLEMGTSYARLIGCHLQFRMAPHNHLER